MLTGNVNPRSSYQLELASAVKAVLESTLSSRKDSVTEVRLMWSVQTAEDARMKGGYSMTRTVAQSVASDVKYLGSLRDSGGT
jgi:hypothetical protein